MCRFLMDHDINVLEVRNVVSYIRDQKLLNMESFYAPTYLCIWIVEK